MEAVCYPPQGGLYHVYLVGPPSQTSHSNVPMSVVCLPSGISAGSAPKPSGLAYYVGPGSVYGRNLWRAAARAVACSLSLPRCLAVGLLERSRCPCLHCRPFRRMGLQGRARIGCRNSAYMQAMLIADMPSSLPGRLLKIFISWHFPDNSALLSLDQVPIFYV